MNKVILSTATAALLGFAGLVNAAPGAYVQVQGGIGGMDTKNYSATSTPTVNSPYTGVSLRNGAAYRISGGYLWGVASNFDAGVELGYGSYPNNKYTQNVGDAFLTSALNETYSGSNVDLLGVAKYNFGSSEQGAYVVGKLGIARVTQKFKGDFSGTFFDGERFSFAESDTVHGVKPEAVVGVGYNFTKNLSADVSYQHIFAGRANPNGDTKSQVTRISSVNTVMAGLSYHFS